MSAVMTDTTLTVELLGSKDLRRRLEVERTRFGQICVRVLPQRKPHDVHRGAHAALAAAFFGSSRADQISLVKHPSGWAMWFGDADIHFALLDDEAQQLIDAFGFASRIDDVP